jgi:hypothetical protein
MSATETSVVGFESLNRTVVKATSALKHVAFLFIPTFLGWGERGAQARWSAPQSASLSTRSLCPPLFESSGGLNQKRTTV